MAGAPAHAQYPDKPVRIIVPFGAGGGADAAARVLARGLQNDFGRTVLVENRPGGNTVIGANAAAKSAADGYTLLFTSGSTVSVLPHIMKSLPFDPRKDLVPVGKVAKLPFLLLVQESLGVNTLQEFVAKAKAAPGQFTYASAGSGTGAHLGFELLKKDAKIEVTHVPYKTTSEALPDLLSGRVTSMMADPATAQRALERGTVKVIAVTTKERTATFPKVSSIAEQGYSDFDVEIWFGVFVPKGTPEPVMARLNQSLTTFMRSNEGKAEYATLGYTPDPTTGKDLEDLVQRESVLWSSLAKTGALKIE
ncbi:putative exported protein [Variovorax sp. WDL1]|nr:putative exported protein [Variovorax sp. WDL1]